MLRFFSGLAFVLLTACSAGASTSAVNDLPHSPDSIDAPSPEVQNSGTASPRISTPGSASVQTYPGTAHRVSPGATEPAPDTILNTPDIQLPTPLLSSDAPDIKTTTLRPTPGVVEPDSGNKQEVSQPHKDNLGSEITDGSKGATPASSEPVPTSVPDAAVSTEDNSYRRAPRFTLPNATGGVVSLDSYLGEGNVVLVFYRGFW